MFGTQTIERSDPFVADLIATRSGRENLTTADLVGELVLRPLARARREATTQLIVIAGGAASGKSTLALNMSRTLTEQDVPSAIVSSDDFVRGDRGERHDREKKGMPPEVKYNFDEMRRIVGTVCANQDSDRTVEAPQYDAHTGLAIDGERRRLISKVNVLIVEGDMLGEKGAMPQDLFPGEAYNPLALYMHVSDEERLRRRVLRDMQQRNGHGQTPEDIVNSFERRQDTQHLPYTLPYASAANTIVTFAAANNNASLYDIYSL